MLAVGLTGLVGLGVSPVKAVNAPPLGNRPGRPIVATSWVVPTRAESGQAGGQPGRIDAGQGGVPGVLVAGSLGLGGADQTHLAGDLGGQVPDRGPPIQGGSWVVKT